VHRTKRPALPCQSASHRMAFLQERSVFGLGQSLWSLRREFGTRRFIHLLLKLWLLIGGGGMVTPPWTDPAFSLLAPLKSPTSQLRQG
jgi:hypothetical protein